MSWQVYFVSKYNRTWLHLQMDRQTTHLYPPAYCFFPLKTISHSVSARSLVQFYNQRGVRIILFKPVVQKRIKPEDSAPNLPFLGQQVEKPHLWPDPWVPEAWQSQSCSPLYTPHLQAQGCSGTWELAAFTLSFTGWPVALVQSHHFPRTHTLSLTGERLTFWGLTGE